MLPGGKNHDGRNPDGKRMNPKPPGDRDVSHHSGVSKASCLSVSDSTSVDCVFAGLQFYVVRIAFFARPVCRYALNER